MKTITIEMPEQLPPEIAASDEDLAREVRLVVPAAVGRGRASDEDLAREVRLAAAISWYDRGLISQGKGAEIAGLTRSGFIDALSAAHVDTLQVTPEELRAELGRTLDARR